MNDIEDYQATPDTRIVRGWSAEWHCTWLRGRVKVADVVRRDGNVLAVSLPIDSDLAKALLAQDGAVAYITVDAEDGRFVGKCAEVEVRQDDGEVHAVAVIVDLYSDIGNKMFPPLPVVRDLDGEA